MLNMPTVSNQPPKSSGEGSVQYKDIQCSIKIKGCHLGSTKYCEMENCCEKATRRKDEERTGSLMTPTQTQHWPVIY